MSGTDGFNPLPPKDERESRDKELTAEALKRLIPDWVRTGVMIKDVIIEPPDGTTKRVQHGLKRQPVGWLLVSPRPPSAGGGVTEYSICEVSKDSSAITFRFFGGNPVKFDVWIW